MITTKTVRVAVTVAASIALVACGSDDDSRSESPQDEVAELLIQAAEDNGASPDGDCIRDAMQPMSDDDANKIIAVGFGPDSEQPDISTEASELLAEALLC